MTYLLVEACLEGKLNGIYDACYIDLKDRIACHIDLKDRIFINKCLLSAKIDDIKMVQEAAKSPLLKAIAEKRLSTVSQLLKDRPETALS